MLNEDKVALQNVGLVVLAGFGVMLVLIALSMIIG
jgi:hypothetical protein